MRIILPCIAALCIASSVFAQTESSQQIVAPPPRQQIEDAVTAETAWQDLCSQMPVASTLKPTTQTAHIPQQDWASVAEKAREYQEKFPDSAHAKEARKLELSAALFASRGRANMPAEIQAKMNAYMADPTVAASDRYEISARGKDVRDLRFGMKREEMYAKRLAGARELVAEYPAEPRAWKKLLTVAGLMAGKDGLDAARQIARSENAPAEMREQARRLTERLELNGRPLEGIDISAAKGKPVIVYFWTAARPEINRLFRHYAQVPGVAFFGVNIDADSVKARELSGHYGMPGEQHYDGQAGPIARRLKNEGTPAIYLVAKDGVLVDTQGHIGAFEKLQRMAGVRPTSPEGPVTPR